MISTVDRESVRLAVENDGAQIVEVLPEPEYRWAHLPGARNIPLKKLDMIAKEELAPDRQIIVYRNDLACDMSPRAAVALGRLGFPRVRDYPAGKMDWLDADLPHAGESTLAGRVVRRDPIVARLRDTVRDVASRLLADPAGFAVVVTDQDVVQGTIGGRHADRRPDGAGRTRADESRGHGMNEKERTDVPQTLNAGYGHPHGRPRSWPLVCAVIAAFAGGGVALILGAWWLFWVCAAIVVLSVPVGAALGVMEDTVRWTHPLPKST